MTTNNDTRSLSPEIQQYLRVQIVKLRQAGKTNREVASTVGVSERHASVVWQRYLKDGAETLTSKKRGRRCGQHKKIGDTQATKIFRLMLDKPTDIGISGELWTRCRLQQVVKQHLKIQVSIRTIGGLLSHWVMIPQKPIDISNINAPIIPKWLNTEYKRLLKRVEAENGELHWYVEQMASHRQEDQYWAPSTQYYPMLASISRQGQIRFAIHQEEITPKMFREFLCRLTSELDKKVFLLVKKIACLHINNTTEAWLEDHRDRIEVVYLPI